MNLGEKTRTPPSTQSGFSLVEIMVGVAIGLIAVIVMFQVFAISEDRKQTTTAGGDAQNNAVIVLDQIQRDISRAGYGFAQFRLMGCNIKLPSTATAIPLAPVIVYPSGSTSPIPAGDANTDIIVIAYGNSDDQPDGYRIDAQSGTTYTITGTSLLKSGDLVLVTPDLCGSTTLSFGAVQSATGSTIKLSTSSTGSAMFNLGPAPTVVVYAIRNGNLTICNFMTNDCTSADSNNWQPIAENVVSLRAEYGRDTTGTMDGVVDTFDQTVPANACAWSRASAIRFALTARSPKFEVSEVTSNAPSWLSTSTPVNLTSDANWKHYRYKLFQTVVPIRNVAWMGAISGC